jgi:hypothetical protein
VAGVGHVAYLPDADAPEVRMDRIRPGRFDVCRTMQTKSLHYARQYRTPNEKAKSSPIA